MPRQTRGSRVQVAPAGDRKRARPKWDDDAEPNNNSIRRGGEGKLYNRIHSPDPFYGFLTEADGPERGPWDAVFECTPRRWMDYTMLNLPHDTRQRVLRVLDGRTLADAWENCGIGERVVLRHAHARYLEALDADADVELVRYEILLDREDIEDRFNLQTLRTGHWYGLELLSSVGAPALESGIYRVFDRNTLELGDEQSYALQLLTELPPLPERAGEVVFRPFETEALVEAFHSRFGEFDEQLPDDYEEMEEF